jgi:hypothetical protein
MSKDFQSEEEKAEQERLRRELARKWEKEQKPEAEKFFNEHKRDESYRIHYNAEVSKNLMRDAPIGFNSPAVWPGQAHRNALKWVANDEANFLQEDKETYIEQGVEAAAKAKNQQKLGIDKQQRQAAAEQKTVEQTAPSEQFQDGGKFAALRQTHAQVITEERARQHEQPVKHSGQIKETAEDRAHARKRILEEMERAKLEITQRKGLSI